ncbi:hypothetical protein BpHYR1_031014 [Brachionus plicatilis]|uniref:Uncharacterized protein n=1 Tax=Brachionus plicatilis TaxID=10195 RepID=A0A3M7P8A3_BRAPC|nr:hypothetical protein BpHYR1_031014 [Brachionus plicatilis]
MNHMMKAMKMMELELELGKEVDMVEDKFELVPEQEFEPAVDMELELELGQVVGKELVLVEQLVL